MHLFERPCLSGWIYPCSLEDIAGRLAQLPQEDREGLWAVGLVPATRKDCNANGRYFFEGLPTIHLYSYPDTLRFRLPAHTKHKDIEEGFLAELEYGMKVEAEGSRYICDWTSEDLRRFVVEHVLLHEVGHHVYHTQRKQQRYAYRPHTVESEQFAEAYALRYRRQQRRQDCFKKETPTDSF